MGKKIRVQRSGRGGSVYKASVHKRIAPAQYPFLTPKEHVGMVMWGQVEDLVHDPGRGAPLALIRFEDGKECYTIVPEGVHTSQKIEMGGEASVKVGNILPLAEIPEGTVVCNIELHPGDGGKIARSSGAHATVIGHTGQGTMVELPSGKTKYLNDDCRATIGVVSGGGRTEKPFLKAGAKFHLMKSKGHKYPRTRGRAMIAAVHPHGSSKRGGRKIRPVSHNAPPGQKVGLIAARSSGKKKRK